MYSTTISPAKDEFTYWFDLIQTSRGLKWNQDCESFEANLDLVNLDIFKVLLVDSGNYN